MAGTAVLFIPPTGVDTLMRGGVLTAINTKHQCITCMKEYENKSLEELRYEDYVSNRINHLKVPGLRTNSLSTRQLLRDSQGPRTTPGNSTSGFNFSTAEMSTPWLGTTGTGTSPFGSTANTTSSSSTTPPPFVFSTSGTGTLPFGAAATTTSSFSAPSTFGSSTPVTVTLPFGTAATTTNNSFTTPSAFGFSTPGTGTLPFGATATTTNSSTPSVFGFSTPRTGALPFGATPANSFSTASSAFGFSTPVGVRPLLFTTTTNSFSTTQPAFGFSTVASSTSPFGTTTISTNNSSTPSTFGFGAAGTGTPSFGTTTKNSSASSFGFGLHNTLPFGTTGTPNNSTISSLTRSGTSLYQTSGQKKYTPYPNDVEEVGKLWYEWVPSWQVTWTVDSLPDRSFKYGIASPKIGHGLDFWRLYIYSNGLPTSCPGDETQSAGLTPLTNLPQSGVVPEEKTPGDIVLAIVPKSVHVMNPGQHFRLDVMLSDKTLLKSFRFKKYSKDGKLINRNFVLPHEIAKRISFSYDQCSLICKLSMEAGEEPRAEASSQIELTSGTDELAKDLKNLLLSEEASDATVRVKGQDFKVHRIILGARTPVFSAMFRHDTSERTSGIVNIEDCEPDIFRMFLQYVYSGQVEGLTAENAAALYEVAKKYQVNGLKEKCLEMVKTDLSVESLCDAISLSLKHDEKELTTLATGFFADNIKKIIRTVEWQNFLTENPIQANELLVKAHEK